MTVNVVQTKDLNKNFIAINSGKVLVPAKPFTYDEADGTHTFANKWTSSYNTDGNEISHTGSAFYRSGTVHSEDLTWASTTENSYVRKIQSVGNVGNSASFSILLNRAVMACAALSTFNMMHVILTDGTNELNIGSFLVSNSADPGLESSVHYNYYTDAGSVYVNRMGGCVRKNFYGGGDGAGLYTAAYTPFRNASLNLGNLKINLVVSGAVDAVSGSIYVRDRTWISPILLGRARGTYL